MTEEELSRRAFLKRMAVVGFAVPVITSFALDSVSSGDPGQHYEHRHHYPNQTHPNQTLGNQNPIETIVDDIIEDILGHQGGKP
jgi:hypothetical protein